MSGLSGPAARSQRSDLLDLIRTVAIVMVVFFHVSTRHGTAMADMDVIEAFFRRWGSKGVDIFFPLSGYLICSFLLSSQRADFIRAFFLRRVFRILPLYLVAVTLAMAGMYVLDVQTYLLDRFWVVYTFLTAWVIHAQGLGTVPYTITWSLSVEEFAYVIFGIMAWINRRRLPHLLLALSILPLFLKMYLVAQDQGFYFLPVARIDSIAIGGVAAWLLITGRRPLLWLGLALALAWGLAQTGVLMRRSLVLIQLALATSIVIVIFETGMKGWRNRVTAALASIGFYSYFTYLFHIFVIDIAYKLAERGGAVLPPFWAMAVLCLALTHIAAILSYRWFEGPMMRWGRSFEAQRDGAIPRAAPDVADSAAAPARPLSRGSP